jgi:hypothetical protein
MQTYSTDRPKTYKKAIIELLIGLALLPIPYTLHILFDLNIGKDPFYYIVFGVAFINFLFNLFTKTISQISFDESKGLMLVTLKSLTSAPIEKQLSLARLLIEIDHSKPWIFRERVRLYVLKEKRELFEMISGKDGFSTKKLLGIIETAKRLSIPVKNL